MEIDVNKVLAWYWDRCTKARKEELIEWFNRDQLDKTSKEQNELQWMRAEIQNWRDRGKPASAMPRIQELEQRISAIEQSKEPPNAARQEKELSKGREPLLNANPPIDTALVQSAGELTREQLDEAIVTFEYIIPRVKEHVCIDHKHAAVALNALRRIKESIR